MISFIFPLYKQEHVLKKSITLLQQYLSENLQEKYEIILCIDGSPGGDLQIASQLGEQFKTVRIISYKKNMGRGYAIKYAGMSAKGEYIVYMDCDLVEVNYLKYIDEMIQKVKVNDVVIASRFLPESNSVRKWKRKLISKSYRILIQIIFRDFHVTDPDVGFKGIQKECFQNINLMCNLNGPSWDLQFLVNAHMEGYKITEFPFQYIENYELTTVNLLTGSIIEFLGLIYIKVTSIISKYAIF